MANKYDLELAIDTYRAQNGKESEIGLFGDQLSGFEYGSNRFSSREQVIWWLKQQKPNHEAIKKMIAEERKNYPNSGLNPLFEVYERYYPQVQQVQENTRNQLEIQKPNIQIDTRLQNKLMKLNKDIRTLNEDGKIDMGPKALSVPKDSEVLLTGNKKSIDGSEYVEFSKVIIAGKIYEQKGWLKLVDLTDDAKVASVASEISSGKTEKKPSKTPPSTAAANKAKSNVTPSHRDQVLVDPKTGKPLAKRSTESTDRNMDVLIGLKSEIERGYNDFMSYAKEQDKWFSGLRTSKEDISAIRKNLAEKYQKFNQSIQEYIKNGGKEEEINHMRLTIAYYYADDLSGVSANNQMDVVTSQNICIDILRTNLSPFPTTQEQLYATLERLQTHNPKLADLISQKIEEQNQKGEPFNLSAILSNPLVKGAWEKAYDEVYAESLATLDKELDNLKGDEKHLSELQRRALNHLRDMRGKNGLLSFTVQNREQMWQMVKYGGAVVAGIVGTALTASGVGSAGGAPLLALSSSVIAGTAITTGGTLLAQGYHGSAGEIAGEAGINLLSFGGGAMIFKLATTAKALELAAKAGQAGTYGLYALEGAGNVAIGVGTDNLRAYLKGEDLDIWSSLQQNLIWAALPFAFRAKGKSVPPEIMNDANQVSNTVQAANVQAALGKSTKSLLEKVKAPLERLKSWGKKNTQPVSNTETPITRPDGSNLSDLKKYLAVRDEKDLPGNIFTTNKGKYDYSFWDNGQKVYALRREKGGNGKWREIKDDQIPSAIREQMKQKAGVSDTSTPKATISEHQNTQGHAESASVVHEAISAQAEHPKEAHAAVENVAHSSKKMGETFSLEWLEKISHKIGKPVKWVADQSVGPVFRMVTGNNPGALLSLVNPMGGWTGKVSAYGKNFANHWKSPVRNSIDLLITGERKDGQGVISSVAKNVLFAGGITALDYFAVPNNQANTPENMVQNYYEMVLLGWLGVVLMEKGPIIDGVKDAKDWLSDRMQAKPF